MRGLERGLERAIGPIDTIAHVEIEAVIAENLVRQMEQGVLAPAPVFTDVKAFLPMEQGVLAPAPVFTDVKAFLPIARRLRGYVDIITGGYPCQPFSHVGKQRGSADPRHLWPYIHDIVDAIGPVCCWFENVSNHINLGYEQVRADLQELGYTVEEGIFSAEEVGAPHIRKRLFILALDNALCGRYGGPEEKICARRESTIFSSEKLDHPIISRLEGYSGNDGAARGWEGSTGSTAASSFPMGQGYEQHGWEAGRIESRMGFTVNGYNYREDLLRMAGNAVVEQTAELAFRTLIKKFK